MGDSKNRIATFHHPQYPPAMLNRLIWSNLAAQSAEQVALAAVPIVAAIWLAAGPAETGLLSAAQTLPFLLLSLPAGVLADRMPRRRLMVGAEILRALALTSLPLLAWAGLLSLAALGTITFAAATGTVVYSVTAPALVPSLVPRDRLAHANTRLELARSTAFAAGPPIAGAMVAWTSAPFAFALAASLSTGAALLLRGLPPGHPTHQRATVFADLAEGARFAWAHPLIRPILLTAVIWNSSWFILQSVYTLYAIQALGMGPAQIGASLGMYGVGMVCGALAAPRIGRAMPFGWVITAGPLASVLAASLLALTVIHPAAWLAYAAYFVFGAGPILWTITQTTLRQAVTPAALLGRVSALMMMMSFGARPLGALLGGYVGERYGLGTAIILCTVGFALQALMIIASPLPRLPALPAAAPHPEAAVP